MQIDTIDTKDISSAQTNSRNAVLAIPHLLQRILSFLEYRPLTRCLRVHTDWYDAATASLWRHVSYRSNPFLIDPGVTPFLPVPQDCGDGEHKIGSRDCFKSLRVAKRRAMRHVKIIDIRTHKCDQVGCRRMTLHAVHEDAERNAAEADPTQQAHSAATCTCRAETSESIIDPISKGGERHTSIAAVDARQHHGASRRPASAYEVGGSSLLSGDTARLSTRPTCHLLALRLHLDEKHPRPLPYPCPFFSLLDARTIVLVPLRRLSNPRPLPLPAMPSLRKLVLLLIPHTGAPEMHQLAHTIPTTVDDIVIFLWRRHSAGEYDHFRGHWAGIMKGRRWGPDKVWGHWCNFVIAYTRLFTASSNNQTLGKKGKMPRYTFVNTGVVDSTWLDMANNGPIDFSNGDLYNVDSDEIAAQEKYRETEERFAAGLRACLEGKVRDLPRTPGSREGVEIDIKRYLGQVRFMSRDEYLAEGGWEGEFTRDEVMYHG